MAEKSRPGRKAGTKAARRTKDRVLQARIPRDLDLQLRDRADRLGLSVSTIVRNVLLNTFDLVEDIVTDSAQITQAIQGTVALREPEAGSSEVDVVAWQESVLNLNGVCEQCNTLLPRGCRAAIGVPTGTRPRFLCAECLDALVTTIDSEKPEAGQ